MISINLITSLARKKLIKETVLSLLRDVLMLLLITILLNSIFVFTSYRLLNKNFEEIRSQREAVKIQNQPFNEEIIKINQKLKAINVVQADFVKWSEKLVKLLEIIPNGIRLTSINFDQQNNFFQVTGLADTRNSFLEFKGNLEQSNIVKNVNSPLSNLLKQENLTFSLTAELGRD